MGTSGARGGRAGGRDATLLVTSQLGRPPRGRWQVVRCCPFDFPAVIETAPYLDDGTPFPTLYYLTCPSAVEAVARAETSGGVEAFRQALAADAALAAAVDALDHRYRRRRRQLAESIGVDGGEVLDQGIGGSADPSRASCLHAYAAALLAAGAAGCAAPFGSVDPPISAGPAGSAAGSCSGRAPDPDAPAGVDVDSHPGDPPVAWQRLLSDMGPLWCDDARCARLAASGAVRRAAIDVGTNSVRLLVALVDTDGRVHTVVRRGEITQLGAGLTAGARLDPVARRRSAAAVARFVEEARGLGVECIRLVGTSATRDAADGSEFIESLGESLKVSARVASGPEEARLSYLGATLDVGAEAVVIDVGGGSTEIVGSADAVSLDLGCVRGTEAWFTADPPPRAERAAARRATREAVAPSAQRFASGSGRLVGVAGTITTLACLALDLASYDSQAIHLRVFTREEMEAQIDTLADLDPGTRAALPCMQEGRARVIVAGGEILLGAMEALGWEEIVVSERDMLDGILLEDDPA